MSDFTVINAKSKVDKVTLYEERAQVQRTAEVKIVDSTDAEVIFDDLPARINRDSLQCNVFSFDDAPAVTLKGIVFDTKTVDNEDFESLTAKQKEAVLRLAEIEKELKVHRDKIATVKGEGKFIAECFDTAVSTTQKQDAGHDYNLEGWERMLDETVNAKKSALTSQREIELAMDKLLKEQDAVQPLAVGTPQRSSTRNVVKVLLSAEKPPGPVVIELTYMVEEASWTAAYEMRVNSETGDVRIGYNAILKQNTVEAWDDVTVELSTAKPNLSGKQPELKPWRLNIAPKFSAPQRKAKSSGWSTGASRSAAPQMEMDECLDSILERGEKLDCLYESADTMATIEAAEVDTAATSVTFKVPGTHTIKTGNKEARVTIMQLEVTSTLSFVTVPKESEAAFALAHATNTSEYLLVAGTANVFLDGHYVTKATQARTAPKETFDIGVGVDESIAIKYKKLARVESKEGNILSGKKSVVDFKYQVSINNHKKVAVKVLLKDQIPVSQDDKLVVTRHEPAQLAKGQPQDDGTWELPIELAPGKSKDILIHFDVAYPRGEKAYGLN